MGVGYQMAGLAGPTLEPSVVALNAPSDRGGGCLGAYSGALSRSPLVPSAGPRLSDV